MEDTEIKRLFKKARVYKKIGFILALTALAILVIFQNKISVVLAVIIITISIFFDMQFKCPRCDYRLNPRLKDNNLLYCQRCGAKLQDEEDIKS